MNVKDIKVGMKLKIVGKHGGCGKGDNKRYCNNCQEFEKGIEVTALEGEQSSGFGLRTVCGNSLTDDSHCSFDPRDLEPFEITNWKEELQ